MSERVTGEPIGRQRTRGARSLLPLLLILLVTFLLGAALTGWVLARWDTAASFVGVRPEAKVAEAPAAPPVNIVPATVEPARTEPGDRLVIDPEISRRVATLEQRLAALDSQSRAAVGNADRAEGLLVAFAARRALDRGVSLGYLEGMLRRRFGESEQAAVATVLTAAREPVTLEELQQGLQEMGPRLTGAGPDQNWWDAMKAELGTLVTIRRSERPSTLPVERLRRTERRLEAGQVDVALAEVLRMPGREHAAEWIEDARRYVAARRALDRLEAAALLAPRTAAPQLPPAETPATTPAPLR